MKIGRSATARAMSAFAAAMMLSNGAFAGASGAPATPIEHVVVIFQENVSFDHYFGTYPFAANTDGSKFTAQPGTPTVNGLTDGTGITGALLANNPNFDGTHGNPFRLSSAQGATCDQDHGYTDEQLMADSGLMDNFLAFNTGSTAGSPCPDYGHSADLIMGYYDGNTVTALWNYAQDFVLEDNSYGTTYGPSSPGAINVISGNTAGATQVVAPSGYDDIAGGSLIDDAQPAGDACTTRDSATMSGKNIGDLLNAAGVSWGWFEGGFDLTITNPDGSKGCHRSHTSAVAKVKKVDYIPHHEPFQYYASTANPTHARPTVPPSEYGTSADTVTNHQYDSHDFFDALAAGNLPAVSYIKAAGYQDGHAGYSSPQDEQTFVATVINALEKSKFWSSTAVIINWDDSDGWYDHQLGQVVRHSQTSDDGLTGPNTCGSAALGAQAQGRCGFGPRIPMLVISGWAKANFADHTLTDQSSIVRFIEDNWKLGRIPGSTDAEAGSLLPAFDFSQHKGAVKKHLLWIDPATGLVLKKAPKS
jgi:phospholipase C